MLEIASVFLMFNNIVTLQIIIICITCLSQLNDCMLIVYNIFIILIKKDEYVKRILQYKKI